MTSPLAPTDEGAVAERLRERILVNFALYDKLTHNLKLCLSFRGAERRGNPFSSGIMCIPLAVHMGCGLRDRCVHRSRNDRTLCCLFFSIMAADRVWRPLSPVCALGTYPRRGSASQQRFRTGAAGRCSAVNISDCRCCCYTPLGAPFRGAVGGSRLRGHQSRDVSRVKKKEYITRNNVIRDGTEAVPYDGAFSAVASDAPQTCVYPPFR